MRAKLHEDKAYLVKSFPAFEVKAPSSMDAESRTLEAVISSNSVDRDGEIIHPQAFKKRIDTFLKNPVLLWNHNPGNPPIGAVEAIDIGDKAIEALVKFRPEGTDPLADNIFAAYRDGFLKTFSIGFRVFGVKQPRDEEGRVKGPLEITDAELLELSAVPIPANPDAMVKMLATGNVKHVIHARDLDDAEVLTRAQEIVKRVYERHEAGLDVAEPLFDAIESLRLGVLRPKAGISEEGLQKLSTGASSLLDIYRNANGQGE